MPRQETCTWTLDDGPNASIWNANCGAAWSFTEGGPEDNGCNYCHKCGGKLVIVWPDHEACADPGDDDDDITGQRWEDG